MQVLFMSHNLIYFMRIFQKPRTWFSRYRFFWTQLLLLRNSSTPCWGKPPVQPT